MIRFRGRVCTVGPVALDRVDQAVLVGVCGFLGIGSFGLEVGLKLGSIPIFVRCSNFVIPIFLDEIFEIFTIRGRWVWDVVV